MDRVDTDTDGYRSLVHFTLTRPRITYGDYRHAPLVFADHKAPQPLRVATRVHEAMTTALDAILADLRTMVGNITRGWMSPAQMAIEARRLAERFSEVDELLTTARSVLTESDALALGQIIDATHRGAPVARVCDDRTDGVV